jgi:PAS domain S-box-containing protein
MNLLALIFLITSGICFFLGSWVFFQDTKSTLHRLFMLLSIIASYLAFMEFGNLQAKNSDIALLALRLTGLWPIGIALLFHFVLVVTENSKPLKNKLSYFLIYGPAIAFSVLQLTTGLVTGEPVKQHWGWIYAMPSNLLMPALVSCWAIGLAVISIFMCILYDLRTVDAIKKQQSRYILIGICVPTTISVLSHVLLAPLQIEIPGLATAAFVFGIGFVGYAIWRYKLFVLTPAAAAQGIISTMSDALLLVSPKGKILTANEAALRTLGYEENELIGKSVEILFPEEEMRKVSLKNPMLEQMLNTGSSGEIETTFVTKDTRKLCISLSTYAMEGRDDVPHGIVCIARDITELKRAEEEKQRIEQQLNLAGRLAAIGELAAGVAHELNNPLAAIQGFAQLLTSRNGLDETTKKDLETIYREAQRASRITQNLLSFARRHKPEKSLISINDAITKSLDLHSYRMKVNNIELSLELDLGLPKTMADFYQMQQVFVNIINNAEQAMAETLKKGRLCIETKKVGQMIQITFADNGPGIPEENLKRIFDPFFTTKAVGKGTGLGLSICYGIIREHNGHIYARSKFGEGATFVVEIPIISASQPALVKPSLVEARRT